MKKSIIITAIILTYISIFSNKILALNKSFTLVIHRTIGSNEVNYLNESTILKPDKNYGLDNVEFSIYEINDYIIKLDKPIEEIQTVILNTKIDDLIKTMKTEGNLVDKVVTSSSGSEIGTAEIKLEIEKNKYNTYLILESNTPNKTQTSKFNRALPILISLPNDNIQESDNNIINIYPKLEDLKVKPPTAVNKQTKGYLGTLLFGLLLLTILKNKGEHNEKI